MAAIAPTAQNKRIQKDDDNDVAPGTPSTPVSVAENVKLSGWTEMQASKFLLSLNYLPKTCSSNCLALGVDGLVLTKLNERGWKELAAPETISQISISKVMAEMERLDVVATPVENNDCIFIDRCDDDKIDRLKDEKDFVKFCDKKVYEGGAEHTRQWIPCIANANSEGAALKGHVLRFLGMYNVVDLLTVTIVCTYLYDGKEALPENYFEVVMAFLFCLSGVLSGTGMTLSTILYNTASSVGEANFHAFVKTYGVNKALMFVNDASIWGFNFLCFAFCITFIKLGFYENSFSSPFDITKCILPSFPVVLLLVHFMPNRVGPGVQSSTNYALFGGLMSDVEVIPKGETSGWAIRWSQEDVTRFMLGVCRTNMDLPHSKPWTDLNEMEINIMKMYSDQTSSAREAGEFGGGGIASLVNVLGGLVGGAAPAVKRRSSHLGKVHFTPGDGGMF